MSKLQAIHLAKHYHSRQIIKDISLAVETGEIVGLLGPNGAGKTTSFYLIVGLIKCTQGQILLDEHIISYLPIHARARAGISYLPQEPSIFRKLSAADNIMAILQLRRDINPAQKKQRLESLLHEFKLTHLHDTLGIALSGGERRRVEIARALALEPKFILLDEPFAGIDPIAIVELKRIISQLSNQGLGLLITDHNVRETLTICKRAYIVSGGEVIGSGSPQMLLNNQKVREVYLGHEFDL